MKTQIIAAVGLAKLALAQTVLNSGSGFGTYYYDVEDTHGCSNDFTNMNTGFVECSNSVGLSLNKIDSNYLVAMNHTLLAGNLAKYCGRKVVVSVNGVPSNLPFYIGDGCERCGTGSSNSKTWNPNGAPGLDFSLSALTALNSQGCFAGHIDISWQIVDQTLYNFDTNAPGQPQGPVSGSGSGGGSTGSGSGSTGSCSWEGHCLGATCGDDNDCSDPYFCSNGVCSSDSSSSTPPPATCSWEGHCAGASCSTENDCSDSLTCVSGKCA